MHVATFVVAASWPTSLACMLGDLRVGAMVLRDLLFNVSVVILGRGRWKLAQFDFRGNISGAFVLRSVFGLPEKKKRAFCYTNAFPFSSETFFLRAFCDVHWLGVVEYVVFVLRWCCLFACGRWFRLYKASQLTAVCDRLAVG